MKQEQEWGFGLVTEVKFFQGATYCTKLNLVQYATLKPPSARRVASLKIFRVATSKGKDKEKEEEKKKNKGEEWSLGLWDKKFSLGVMYHTEKLFVRYVAGGELFEGCDKSITCTRKSMFMHYISCPKSLRCDKEGRIRR
jgi:hypothetical protein